MKTYQDLLKNASNIPAFISTAINTYKTSDEYTWAVDGVLYERQQNTAINKYKKLLYKVTGEAVQDKFSANHKCASNFFNRFITQENQYLLGNGVTFEDENTKDKLQTKRYQFDSQLQIAGKAALSQGVSYGFFNLDHVDVFKAIEFVPLFDEEDGTLKAGIRFWQLDVLKPMRATLYEMDGYTDYIREEKDGVFQILNDKRPYILKTKTTVADGTVIYDGENYPGFPIVPLYGNLNRQSELIGIKEQIDCYDLIKSGFANDLDDASLIYWTLENAGGMDELDLAQFIERMKVVRAAVLDDNVKAEAHTMDIPFQSREAYLTRLEADLYNDARALNVQALAAGNVTATAIRAAYQSLDDKCDEYEYCLITFINSILELAGIEDTPTFKRNRVANYTEETMMIISAAQFLDAETVVSHLPFLSSDEVSEVLKRLALENYNLVEEDDTEDSEGNSEEDDDDEDKDDKKEGENNSEEN